MTREIFALAERLVKAVEEANQLKRFELRASGALPDDGRGRRG